MSTFNEYDYIQLKNRARAETAARQWQHVTQTARKAARNAHIALICKIYVIAFGLVGVGAIQWFAIITNQRWAVKVVKQCSFAITGLIFLNFLMMVLIQIILRSKRSKSKLTVIGFIFVTVQVSSATLAMPLTQSMPWNWLKSAAFTLTVAGISLIIALVYHLEMEHDHLFLTMWSIRFFLMTSTWLLLTLAFDNLQVVISITLILVFFVTIFIIMWGRSLGSLEFYREESSYLCLYITLTYLNFLSLLTNTLVLFRNIELLQNLALS